jgi:hypothetical protein
MVAWSQIGAAGYLVGAFLGGDVADGPGIAYLGLVPATAGLLVLGFLWVPGSRALRGASP